MEMRNTNQAVNIPETPAQPEPISTILSKPINKLPLIISGVLLLFLVGGGAYYLGTQKSSTPNQVANNTSNIQNQQLLPIQQETNFSPTPKEVTWRTESVQLMKETAVSGSENISLAIQFPTDWTLERVHKVSNPDNLITNCADYVLTSADAAAKLTISPVCDGWSAAYSNWPKSAVTIKEEKNVGNDGHTAYTVRYLDSATNQYKYVEGEKGASDKIMDSILIRYNESTESFLPTQIMLDYSGTETATLLATTDKIITSLKAQ